MVDLVTEEKVVCMDLSVVKGVHVPGVSDPCPTQGFDEEEIEDLMVSLGEKASTGQLKAFSVTEYNPAIEKHTTGTFILTRILCAFI